MSEPKAPNPAKLIVGFFLKEKALAAAIVDTLQKTLGPIDMISDWIRFDFTRYYAREMGVPLNRRMVVFKQLVAQARLAAIKRLTNEMELKFQKNGRRQVNIDPGYLLPERFVLATGKNFTHRIYIGEGIYADLTLIYQKGAFRALPWTYPDYSDPRLVDFLTLVRKKYMLDLKTAKHQKT